MIKAVIFDCFGVLISDGLERVCRRLEIEDPEARSFISETIHLRGPEPPIRYFHMEVIGDPLVGFDRVDESAIIEANGFTDK